MIQEHPIDELSAYALGSLEESELKAVERHLAICAECRTEVTGLRDAVANLALSVEPVEPPPQLKSAILARIVPTQTPVRSKNLRNWLRNLQPAWGVAAFAMIVLLVVSNLILWNQVRALTQNTPVSSFQVVSLAGTGSAEAARGVMIVTENGRFGTLVVDALPELDKEQQYQLWLILDGQRTSGGVFSVDSWGYGALVIRAPLPLNAYSDFGVTVEPAGGSPAPTGDKVLGGSF